MRPRDLLAQTAVMLANQAAIRLGLASPEHADREQAREAIDALAGIVDLLAPLAPPEELEALRRDLAQLRMAFVQSAEAPGGAGRGAGAEPARTSPGGAPVDLDARRRGLARRPPVDLDCAPGSLAAVLGLIALVQGHGRARAGDRRRDPRAGGLLRHKQERIRRA